MLRSGSWCHWERPRMDLFFRERVKMSQNGNFREDWKCPRKFPRMNHFIVKMSHHRHLSIPFGGLVCWKNIPERLRDKCNCKEVDCTRWPALKEEVPSVYHCSENPHYTVTQRRILRKSEIKVCCVNSPTLAQKLMKSASSTWNKAERAKIKYWN